MTCIGLGSFLISSHKQKTQHWTSILCSFCSPFCTPNNNSNKKTRDFISSTTGFLFSLQRKTLVYTPREIQWRVCATKNLPKNLKKCDVCDRVAAVEKNEDERRMENRFQTFVDASWWLRNILGYFKHFLCMCLIRSRRALGRHRHPVRSVNKREKNHWKSVAFQLLFNAQHYSQATMKCFSSFLLCIYFHSSCPNIIRVVSRDENMRWWKIKNVYSEII